MPPRADANARAIRPSADRKRLRPLLTYNGAVRREPEIDRWLDRQAADLGAIARRWFERLRACGPDVSELMHDGYATVCIGDVPFAYVGVFTSHVNLGFFYGYELSDPNHLLKGAGKRMRHVTLRPTEREDDSALGALVRAAYADVRRRIRLQPSGR